MKETHFKNTELGLIPVDWEVTTLGEIGSVAMCKRVFKEQTQSLGEIPFYKIGTFGGIADAYISRELLDFLKSEYRYPQKGDLLISAAGTIGRVVEYDGEDAYFQDSNIIWLEHNENNILNAYLKHLYRTIKWQTENGGIVSRLYNSDFNATTISIPPILEQEKIAEALSDVDALIQELGELIEKKRLIKQAAMQQLLSGKTRLPGFSKPWIEHFISESFDFVGNNTLSREQLGNEGKVLDIHYGDILVKYGEITNVSKVEIPKIKGQLIAKHPLQNGDIIIADTAEDELVGKVTEIQGVNEKIEVEAGLHTIVLRPKHQYCFGFLGYLLNDSSFHNQLLPHIQGIKVSSVSKGALLKLSIKVPSDIDEQRAIAEVLIDMDNEIAELESKREKYQSIKQGMMQELLTGRIRLVEPSVSNDLITYCHEPSVTRLAAEP